MYSLSKVGRGVRRGLENPEFFRRLANRAYYLRLNRRAYNERGVDVFAEDWDNLILLDACRYDLFVGTANLPGDLSPRQSRGSHTTEFLRGNFTGEHRDTVYVTATPQYHRSKRRGAIDCEFHEVVNVWSEGGWSDEYGTVLPETMTEYVRRAAERFPDKRIFAHYLQPHYPFVGGDTAFDADTGLDFGADELDGDDRDPDVWERLFAGEIRADPAAVWEAYERNLEGVLPSVEDLLDELGGRTVVTSDHGNVFDERIGPFRAREWGHPPGIHASRLVTVPWLVHTAGDRRRITEGATGTDDEVDDDVVANRLRQLGYAE